MKNIQVIDGAENCAYDTFAATDKEFALIFPAGQDIEFIDDFVRRVGKKRAGKVLAALWRRRQNKKEIQGLHGTLFYELAFKKKYYPTKKDNEAIANPSEKDNKSP